MQYFKYTALENKALQKHIHSDSQGTVAAGMTEASV